MLEQYQRNITESTQEVQRLHRQINTNSLLRLGLILGGSIALFQVFQTNNVGLLLFSVFVLVLVFAGLVRRQSKLEKARDEREAFLKVNENEMTLFSGKENMYSDGSSFEDGKHPYSSDLDIFGQHSLFAKINRTATPDAVERLASWFSVSASKKDILGRQSAVAELAQKPRWIQNFQTKLLFNLGKNTNIKTFLTRYLGDDALVFGGKFMRSYVQVAPYLLLVMLLFSFVVMPIWSYVVVLGLIHFFWTLSQAGRVSHFSSRIDKVGATLIAYSDAVKMIEEESFEAELNQSLQSQLRVDDNEKLSSALRKLGMLVDKLDARNNMLVGAILNILFLWDFRQVIAIQRWKSKYERNVLDTFDVIATYESLLSLAVLQLNHPSWCVPTLLDDTDRGAIRVQNLTHPLIEKDKAVANDYTSVDHRIALVTGSNMAGKSTFLRTVGINAVLAYAGAVVSATQFSLPIFRIVTYMRIKDNLNESTSTFKAELDRMRFILTIVETTSDSFFLIDEMLRGTNSVDKYLGSRAIIKKLVALNGKGMVATHDLQLSTLEEEYAGVVKNYHFDIQVHDSEMVFDYKLKIGKCTVFNASMLLQGIGVDVSSEIN